MPRQAAPSTHLVANVRAYYGLDQQELAAYLGISRVMVGHLEAGRRALSAEVYERLLPLAHQRPDAGAPDELTAAELAAEMVAPAPGPLEARRDYCTWQAAWLRRELRPLVQRAAYVRRWRLALPALLADLPADADPTTRQWLLARPTALTPAEVARYHLLRRQAEALETEADTLTDFLASS